MTSLDTLVFFVPVPDTEAVLEALFATGAGRFGGYDRCAYMTPGRGQFRPLAGANPTIGEVGQMEYVDENRVEVTYPREMRARVIEALLAAHPYEVPAYHVIENAA